MGLISSVFAQEVEFSEQGNNIGGSGTGNDWNALGVTGARSVDGGWQDILTNISTYIFLIAGVIAFIYLIYSGFIYLTAGGNPDNAKKGQTGILNAIIGLVIIFMAWGIVRFVVSFLGRTA